MNGIAIDEARKHFEWLRTTRTPEQHIWQVEDKLKIANVGFKALDPAGKKSAAEMEAVFRARIHDAYLRSAHHAFDILRFTDVPDQFIKSIDEDLKKAGETYEVLDRYRIKTAAEVLAEIDRLALLGYRRYVRREYRELQKSGDPEHILSIEKYLPKTKGGFEILDENGKKTAVEILNEIIQLTQGKLPKAISDRLCKTREDQAALLAVAARDDAAAHPVVTPVCTAAMQTVSNEVLARRRMLGSGYALRKRTIDNLARKIARRRTAALTLEPAPAC